MKKMWREDTKHKYCVLGPHRIVKGNRISAPHLYPAFKLFVGESWSDYHPDAELCNSCHTKVCSNAKKNGVLAAGVRPYKRENGAQRSRTDELSDSAAFTEDNLPENEPDNSVVDQSFASSSASFHSALESIQESSISLSSQQAVMTQDTMLEDSQSTYNEAVQEPKTVYHLDKIKACSFSQRQCVVCEKDDKESRQRVPTKVIQNAWHSNNLFMPTEVRACPFHHDGSQFTQNALQEMEKNATIKDITLSSSSMYSWINSVTQSRQAVPSYNFGDDGVPSTLYHSLLGLSKEHFDDLFSYIEAELRNSCNRSRRDALAMWLMLMKSGCTQEKLAIDSGTDQKTVSHTCSTIGDLIYVHFTPHFIGFDHITREDFIRQHNRQTTEIALSIPPGRVISIADGTYLYTDKPMDQKEQRDSFGPQKCRNFHRIMMLTGCSGFILDCIGSFAAKWNDSQAMEWILNNTKFLEFLGENGHVILDRGFKSCEAVLKSRGVAVHSPEWLGAHDKQMSVEKGAKSRLVTMCRWPVEGANGRVKQKFRFFKETIPGGYSEKIPRWFKNVCALLNKYGAPGFTETERNLSFARTALERASILTNSLEDTLRAAGKIRCSPSWRKMDAESLLDFPKLSYQDLESVALGAYHAAIAKKYIDEHIKTHGHFELRFHQDFPDVIRTQIHSRFQGSTIHSAWIQYSSNEHGASAIKGHYCTCRAGARVVSVCAHTATALRYLGRDRYLEGGKRMNKRVKFLGMEA